MSRSRLTLLILALAACDPSFNPDWERPEELIRNDDASLPEPTDMDAGPGDAADAGPADASELDAVNAPTTIPCQIMNPCNEAGCIVDCWVDCALACEAGFECVDASACRLLDCGRCSNYVPTIK